MNRLFKRLLCGVITAAMVVGTLVMPAMAEDGATAKVLADNRLEISTQFYEGTKKVFQAGSNTVTVKTSVTNDLPEAKQVSFSILPYSDADAALAPIGGDTKTVASAASIEFTADIKPASGVKYYKVAVVEGDNLYDAGYLPVSDVEFPDETPLDSFATTHAAHDPSIFKDPKTGTYYAYNSGNALAGSETDIDGTVVRDDADIDCFKSDDLVHWERIDCNFRIPAQATAFFNEIFVPKASKTNTEAWAPDILYVEDDTDHPYWMYYSLSTYGDKGSAGERYAYTRSAIGLVKGKSPTGPWEDCGIVLSSQEGYNTNAIDSNIYTDTNGDRYLIWGSYQKGIHQLKLKNDGKAEGIDYSTNAKIHETSKTGTRLFSTPSGVQGPEGPWMINNADAASSDGKGFRYMFVSCGWMLSTYNIRVARSSLANTWANETASSAHHKLLDHKGRKVGTTFSEQKDLTELWGYKMIGPYQLGDGITYYANGHNSVLHDDGDNWYLVEHCRKQISGYADLQVRKMLWTDTGWPVVSPLVYAGEKEQTIPKEMLYGTWDLSSVGQTVFDPFVSTVGSGSDEKVDVPVRSSEVILQADGKIGNNFGYEIGTWEYDNNHTATLHFTYNGDSDSYEFYRSGDTMKLFALTGYDKDKRESAIVMTGTDQNDIAQFAKKNDAAAQFITPASVSTVSLQVNKSTGGNPIVGTENGGITYSGDPSVMVDGDTVYLYAGHDTSTTADYIIPEYICYSSKDLLNWTPHGSVFSVNKDTVPWASGATSAWAGQVVKHNGTYYMYYCTWANNSYGGYQCIGVATSSSPTGPFVNKSTTPLIDGRTMTTENTSTWNDIDPTVWIETVDGTEHIYLNWGNSENYTCELNSDMVSVKGSIKHTTFKNLDGVYTEAPYLYRRTDENGNYTGKYYLFFAKDWREQWAYATTDDIMSGEWDYGNLMMQAPATSNTSHGAVFDFNGKTYYLYHNGSLPGGSGHRRVANIQEVVFEEDGSIATMAEMSTGIAGTATLLKNSLGYITHEAFTNPLSDNDYPLSKPVGITSTPSDILDAEWEIVSGKADTSKSDYISIQAVNKPGLYLAPDGKNIVITQMNKNSADTAKRITFKTVKGLDGGDSVSFESVMRPGYFITAASDGLVLSDGTDAEACSFDITDADKFEYPAMAAEVDKLWHENNQTVHFILKDAMIYDRVNAYVAEYDSTNTLIGVVSKNNIKITQAAQNIDIDYTRKAPDSLLRLYIWKNMLPIAAARDITATSLTYEIPAGYTSYFAFEDNLTDSKSGSTASTIGWDSSLADGQRITNAKSDTAVYAEGYKNKAVSFTGDGSDGVNLGKVITDSTYTVSFYTYIKDFTQFTAGLFIDADGVGQKWQSSPIGWHADDKKLMIWSHDTGYVDFVTNYTADKNTWYQITIVASGNTATMYVNGQSVGSGIVADVINSNTNTYLAVNYWNTPFNGLMDEMYIYNGKALTADEVSELYNATKTK